MPWDQWLERFRFYHGIAWDNGFVPEASINMIVHLTDEEPAPELPPNVIRMSDVRRT